MDYLTDSRDIHSNNDIIAHRTNSLVDYSCSGSGIINANTIVSHCIFLIVV